MLLLSTETTEVERRAAKPIVMCNFVILNVVNFGFFVNNLSKLFIPITLSVSVIESKR